MKKLLIISLLIALLATLMFPLQSLAQDNNELESAISSAKKILNITDTYDNFNYSMFKQESKTVYNLSWSDSKNKLGNINVTIDSSGKITNYYAYKPYEENRNMSKIPSVSKADALKTANEFILKANASIQGKIEYKADNSPMNINDRSYHFYYTRVENGIPFPQNNVYVSVNNISGQIENFSCTWTDDLVFPSSINVMTVQKAEQAYMEKLGLKLSYKLGYTQDSYTPYLAYSNVYNDVSIDANTGQIVYGSIYNFSENAKKMEAGRASNASYDKDASVVLTPEEKKAVENAANFVDQKKAENIARTALNLDSGFILESINLYSNGRNKLDYIWNMQFNKEEKRDDKTFRYNAGISIDANTGDVLNFYRSTPYSSDESVKYSKDQALKIAGDFIRSMQPVKSNEVEYTTWDQPVIKPMYETEQPRQYSFTYTRKSNSIYFIGNGFNVTVDTITGSVTSYGFTWYKDQLPPSDKIINSSEAHKILFETVGLRLQYMADYTSKMDTKKIIPPPERQVKPDIKLVYILKPEKPSTIDANTGKLLDYSGKIYEEKTVAEYSDIQGITGENEIKILAQFGVSLSGSEFKPGQSIIQRELLYLLEKCINPYNELKLTGEVKDDETLYNNLISSGIIKESEKSPTSTVTKQEAVKYLIRALKYDRVADIKGIYKLPFKDAESIDSNLYGYVAIAYGLNMVKDTDGYFRPDHILTRAEAASAIYNFLNLN